MCGRYSLEAEQGLEAGEELRKVFSLMERYYPGQYKQGEILPGDPAPAFGATSKGAGPLVASFGLLTSQKKLLINARSETVRQKPFFAESFQSRRLVLPSTGFYEWEREGGRPVKKYLFQVPGLPLFYLGALCRIQEGKCRFAILTRPADAFIAEIHDRMPVILRPHQVLPYLRDAEEAFSLLSAPPVTLSRTLQRPSGPSQLSFSF